MTMMVIAPWAYPCSTQNYSPPMIVNNKIKIASLNCAGNLSRHCETLKNWMRSSEIDVLILQETHFTREMCNTFNNRYPNLKILAHCPRPGHAGVAIILGSDQAKWDPDGAQVFGDTEGRLLIASVMLRDRRVSIASAYAPGARSTDRQEWYKRTTATVDDLEDPRFAVDIMGGDWNETWEVEDRTSGRPGNVAEKIFFEAFMTSLRCPEDFPLKDGWRLHNPKQIMYSHTNHSGKGESRVDRMYVREDWIQNTSDWTIEPSAVTDLDHKAVTFIWNKPQKNRPRGPGRWRLKPAMLKRKSITKQCAEILNTIHNEDPVENLLIIKEALQEFLGKEQKKDHRRIAKRKGILIKRGLQLRRQKNPTEALRIKIQNMEAELTDLVEAEASTYAYNAMAKEYMLGERPTKYFFARAKILQELNLGIDALKGKDKRETAIPEEMMKIVEDFYGELYSEKPSDPEATKIITDLVKDTIPTNMKENLTRPITSQEVEDAIRKAATGRSPGLDGIPAEFYKTMSRTKAEGGQNIVGILTKAFNGIQDTALRGLSAPARFTEGVISLLFKKGDRNDLANYRPLTVLNNDYRLYTKILSGRLLDALKGSIGLQQSAFLPGRSINDNVKLVQCAFDEYERQGKVKGLTAIFIDQEKAYDRVSHVYLWKMMKAIGIPKEFIKMTRSLYGTAQIKATINGFQSEPITIACGVRQGDALSCPLYVIAIEGLALLLENNKEIEGIKLDNKTRIKSAMYADDTVVFATRPEDPRGMKTCLGTYCAASGALVNVQKTKYIRAGKDIGIVIEGAEEVPMGEPHKHLGIPVGLRIDKAVTEYWKRMITKMKDAVTEWLKFRLSIRGRVMIAGAKVYSLPRYALFLLPPPHGSLLKEMEKQYWRLVWDEKKKGVINRVSACHKPKQGGVGCQHLDTIIKASAISMVCRMEKHPDYPWVRIAKSLMRNAKTKCTTIKKDTLEVPWRQITGDTRTSMMYPSIQHIWKTWWDMLDWNKHQQKSIIRFVDPEVERDVLSIRHWYYPHLTDRDPETKSIGVSLWKQPIWKEILNRNTLPALKGHARIGDLWDPTTRKPRFVSRNKETQNSFNLAVDQLIRNLPKEWPDITNPEIDLGWEDDDPIFDNCKIACLDTKGEEKLYSLRKVSYTMIYTEIIKKVLSTISFHDKLINVKRAMRPLVKREINSKEIWGSCRRMETTGKLNDLLFRFLHGKVLTGNALFWLGEEEQRCPIDSEVQTIQHIWIECDVAKEAWKLFRTVWKEITGKTPHVPSTESELIGMIAIPPMNYDIDQIRWRIVYSGVIWTIWTAYLKYQFGEVNDYSPTGVRTLLWHAINRLSQRDRAIVLQPRFVETTRHNVEHFTEIWGIDPRRLKGNKWPPCLESTKPSAMNRPSAREEQI